MTRWRLELAWPKCKAVFFKRRETKHASKFPIVLNGTELETVPSFKFLGITIDSKMKFGTNVDDLIVRCRQRLRIIRILSKRHRKLGKKCLTQIYVALVRSLVDYSSLVFCYLRKKDTQRFEVIQKSALKAIYKLKLDTPTSELNKLH